MSQRSSRTLLLALIGIQILGFSALSYQISATGSALDANELHQALAEEFRALSLKSHVSHERPWQDSTSEIRAPKQPTLTPAAQDCPTSINAFVDSELLRDAVQSALERELGAHLPQALSSTLGNGALEDAAADGTDTPESYTAEDALLSAEALDQSLGVLESALANGVWHHEDSRSLAEMARDLSEEDRMQLLDRIGDAINSQQLVLEGPMLF